MNDIPEEDWNTTIHRLRGEIEALIDHCNRALKILDRLQRGERVVEKGIEVVNRVADYEVMTAAQFLESLEIALRT
jgi:hypothetical protein